MKRFRAVDVYDPKVYRKWYLIANRAEAVVYIEGRNEHFIFLERLKNPKGKQTETELDSDKPGKGISSSSRVIHHSLDRHFRKTEQVAVRFAERIGKYLDQAAQQNKFHELILVAEPRFLGILRDHLSPSVLHRRVQTIDRDYYAKGSPGEVQRKIHEILSGNQHRAGLHTQSPHS